MTLMTVEPRTLPDWIEYVKPYFGLTDWTINLSWTELPPNTFARINTAYGRREATILLGEEFLKSSPESQRETLVHELLHCHFAPLDEYVGDSLPPLLGKPAWTAWETAYDLFEERAIDALAVAVADMGTIPLPPEEDK